MKHTLKRLMALLLPVVLCLTLLSACAKDGDGLSLAVSVGDAPASLDPAFSERAADQTILAHLYENLMRVTVDSSGQTTVVGGMAKSVDQEETTVEGGLTVTYTFRLRSARWSDGQSVKASDFVYAWRRLANPSTHSPYAPLLSAVCGYSEARATGDMELLQVTAKNDTTLEVVLDGHHEWFLKEVCTAPATMPLREDVIQRLKTTTSGKYWWSDPTSLVTNGPYLASAFEEGSSLTLEPSSRYYTSLPGPKTLTFHFVDTPEKAQALYDSHTIDVVWPLTGEQLEALSGQEDALQPELKTYSVVFNCGQAPFDDPLLREAMSLAVDRGALVSRAQAAEGLVPPGVPENEEGDFRTNGGPLLENDAEGYDARCQRAQALFQEAGYDSGQDLGELEYLYVQGEENDAAALTLCQQWQEVLQVQITPKGMTAQELATAMSSGEYAAAGLLLDSEVNDAECFLNVWTSSGGNLAFYENSAYDTLMKIVSITGDSTARMGCLHDAEALLLTMDHVLCPLYTEGTAWTLRDSLTGAFRDPRGWFCFSGVVTRTA